MMLKLRIEALFREFIRTQKIDKASKKSNISLEKKREAVPGS